jgi:hypothetical protein
MLYADASTGGIDEEKWLSIFSPSLYLGFSFS